MMNLLAKLVQFIAQLAGELTIGDDEEDIDGKIIPATCRECGRSRVFLIDTRIYARDDHAPDYVDDDGVGFVKTAKRQVVCRRCGHSELRSERDLQREAAPWTQTDARRDVRAAIRLSNDRSLSEFRGH